MIGSFLLAFSPGGGHAASALEIAWTGEGSVLLPLKENSPLRLQNCTTKDTLKKQNKTKQNKTKQNKQWLGNQR